MPPKGKRSRRKKSDADTKTAGVPTVPQPHGGALAVGGTPGNNGGPGRPPSAIRLICRQSFEQRIPILEQIADGQAVVRVRVKKGEEWVETEALMSAEVKDRIRAIDLLGKYGGIEKLTVEAKGGTSDDIGEHVMQRVQGVLARVALMAPLEKRMALVKQLEEAGA